MYEREKRDKSVADTNWKFWAKNIVKREPSKIVDESFSLNATLVETVKFKQELQYFLCERNSRVFF